MADEQETMKQNVENLRSDLEKGISELKLTLSPEQIDLLMRFLALLVKWNHTYNLTAVRDPEEMVQKHLLDSLTVAPYLKDGPFLDVGAGAGLPGIPLAILFPQFHFTLLDSNGKKARFMLQAAAELGLKNVAVQNSRVEAFHPAKGFATILSRAFASLGDIVNLCSPLLQQANNEHAAGQLFCMKGQYPEQELAELPKTVSVIAIHPLQVPGLQEQRHLVCLQPAL